MTRATIVLCKKRKAILAQAGHILVTGGPGCGKTTIALLKARERTKTLEPGQSILFLSFSRAAVQQILIRSAALLTPTERALIQVRTYHSFFIELLQSHGRLLAGRICTLLLPANERLKKYAFGDGWDSERNRLAQDESTYCFDLVASGAGSLFNHSIAVRQLYGEKFPLVIVDEFQDTDNDQWAVVKALASEAQIMCLADADQRIFDYRIEVDPNRIPIACACLNPSIFDLGGENHRSPQSEILEFANAVLNNRGPLPVTKDVRAIAYRANTFDASTHASVVWSFSELNRRNLTHPTIAVLCRSNTVVASVSEILSRSHVYLGKTLRPIDHSVLWDAELSVAAALVVGALMDSAGDARATLTSTLSLVARYYHLKNAEAPTASALRKGTAFTLAAERARMGAPPRLAPEKKLKHAIENGLNMIGEPYRDWLIARELLKTNLILQPLYEDASLVRLFGARDAITEKLGQRWLSTGTYRGAVALIQQILDRERIISSERAPTGCSVMNMHKAKGKEFDAVVIVEGLYKGLFSGQARNDREGSSNRRLLRVAITRARSLVTLVRSHKCQPLIN